MKILKLTAILALVLILGGATAAQALLYVQISDSSNSWLYSVGTSGGAATLVGQIPGLALTDIALDQHTGTMYAVNNTRLYTLDYLHPSGGIVSPTEIPLTGAGRTGLFQGLEVIYSGGTSTIYADTAETSSVPGHLYSITTGGVVTDVGSNGSTDTLSQVTIGNYGDLAYDGLTLYGSFDTEFVHGSATYQGRVTTTGDQAGAVALQGTFTYLGNNVIMDGLAYYNGIFYGVNRGNNIYTPSTLYTILPDGTIANAVVITGLMSGTNIYGMTATPIPPSVFLLGSGLLGLGALGWRRRQRS